MSDINNVPVSQLREAAAAWRKSNERVFQFGGRVNYSLYDRIDEMIGEIDRLREALAADDAEWRESLQKEYERAETHRQERDRLREALTLLLADFEGYPASERPCHAFDVARAALAKEGQ
jgi:predicted secreted protein